MSLWRWGVKLPLSMGAAREILAREGTLSGREILRLWGERPEDIARGLPDREGDYLVTKCRFFGCPRPGSRKGAR